MLVGRLDDFVSGFLFVFVYLVDCWFVCCLGCCFWLVACYVLGLWVAAVAACLLGLRTDLRGYVLVWVMCLGWMWFAGVWWFGLIAVYCWFGAFVLVMMVFGELLVYR